MFEVKNGVEADVAVLIHAGRVIGTIKPNIGGLSEYVVNGITTKTIDDRDSYSNISIAAGGSTKIQLYPETHTNYEPLASELAMTAEIAYLEEQAASAERTAKYLRDKICSVTTV